MAARFFSLNIALLLMTFPVRAMVNSLLVISVLSSVLATGVFVGSVLAIVLAAAVSVMSVFAVIPVATISVMFAIAPLVTTAGGGFFIRDQIEAGDDQMVHFEKIGERFARLGVDWRDRYRGDANV